MTRTAALALLLAALPAFAAPAKKAAPAGTALVASAEARPALQTRFVQALVELTGEHCEEDGGRVALHRHEWNEDALRWAEKTTHPSQCSFSTRAGIEALRFGARLAQPGMPSYEKANELELASYQLLSNEEATEQAVRALLGAGLVVKEEPVASGGVLVRYNPQALETALATLYVKPDETRAGLSLQTIYDLLLKRSVTSFAEDAARVLAKRDAFQTRAKTFAQKLRDPGFYPVAFATEYANAINAATGDDQLQVDPQVVGTLLRRSTDGTLPVVLKALRQVLQDYDPDLFEKLGSKLQP